MAVPKIDYRIYPSLLIAYQNLLSYLFVVEDLDVGTRCLPVQLDSHYLNRLRNMGQRLRAWAVVRRVKRIPPM